MAVMSTTLGLKSAQIGRCGELLVQYLLLTRGIESAPMSTDHGVDLVAYAPISHKAVTIQVKTNFQSKPSGGKGKPALDWWLPENCPAQLMGLVDLSSRRLWFFMREEIPILAQQRSGGRFHIYMYTDPTHRPKNAGRPSHAYEFEKYLIENRAHELFG